MPIYEYECTQCQTILEVNQSISDPPKTTCPTCSGALKKLISMSSFHLKGGGWYSDGYSSSGNCGKKCEASSTSQDITTKKSDSGATCPKANGASCSCS